jgi:hypothetical protein
MKQTMRHETDNAILAMINDFATFMMLLVESHQPLFFGFLSYEI